MSSLSARYPTRECSAVLRLSHSLSQVIGGSLFMAAAAHVTVPFWPVPLTLQTLVVFGLGAAFGPVPAAAAVLAWMVEGMVGLPVFAAGVGPAVLLGPTAGYVAGFLPAALIAGLAGRSCCRNALWEVAATFMAADTIVFAAGVAWLASHIGWHGAIAGGLLPFLLGEALKIGLATAGTTLLAARSLPKA